MYFMQLHGTHKGKVISQEGYRQILIKIGDELGLEKKVRSHGDFLSFQFSSKKSDHFAFKRSPIRLLKL